MALRLSVRASLPRPAAVRSSRHAPVSRAPLLSHRLQVVMRSGSADVETKREAALKEAEDCSKSAASADCAVAWDTYEELSAALDKKKIAEVEESDPLEKFCKEVPEADECRVYED